MVRLNLPPATFRYKELNGKKALFDILRKKFVVITPEEWVRQHFVHFLINYLNYPKSLIKVESGVNYNKLSGRSDVLVYDRTGKVFMLIECKAPNVEITNKVFEQASRYNLKYKAGYLVVTNGINHFCCSISHESGEYNYLDELPPFDS